MKMAFENAYDFLKNKGFDDRVMVFNVSSATVELAALAVGTEPARIAKSMTFMVGENPVMVICAGDTKISSSKFKAFFGKKAVMMNEDQLDRYVGHLIGGVCPFGIKEGVTVYLDDSLRRFDTVYPACGSSNSAVRLTPSELELLSGAAGWTNVCVIREET